MRIARDQDMTRGGVFAQLARFALPILISSVFQQLYTTVDTAIVGNTLGDAALAAIGSSAIVYDMIISLALGIGSGMSIVVARSYGAGNMERLKKSVAGTVLIGLGAALILTVAAQVLLMPLLRLMDTPQEALSDGYAYISVIAGFMLVTFVYNLCAGLLRSVGNSFMPLVFLVISSVVNIVLDILFVARLGMGIQGAAYATVLAQGVSAALCIWYIVTRHRILLPERRHFVPEAGLYRELAAQGLAMGVMNAVGFTGTLALQRAINQLGYLTVAAHTTARRINGFLVMPCDAIATALSTFVSQNRGADRRDRILQGLKTGVLASFVWTAAATLLTALCAPGLARLVTGSQEAEVLDNISRYLRFTAPCYAILSLLLIARNSLHSVGQKTVPVVSSGIELFGKMIFGMRIIPAYGYIGVIFCEPILWSIMTVLLVGALALNPYLRGGSQRK